MRLPGNSIRALACMLLAAGAVTAARADTIVLKNGRRIAAAGVTRENGKVSYETSAGNLSLPESIVERIEKDDTGGLDGGPNRSTAVLNIEPPPRASIAASRQVASLVVHDGAIDRKALGQLDDSAAGGSAEAISRAAAAEEAAGQFEL